VALFKVIIARTEEGVSIPEADVGAATVVAGGQSSRILGMKSWGLEQTFVAGGGCDGAFFGISLAG